MRGIIRTFLMENVLFLYPKKGSLRKHAKDYKARVKPEEKINSSQEEKLSEVKEENNCSKKAPDHSDDIKDLEDELLNDSADGGNSPTSPEFEPVVPTIQPEVLQKEVIAELGTNMNTSNYILYDKN